MIRLNEHVDRQPSEYCYVKRVIGERSMPDQCRRGEARHVAKSFGRRYCLLMVAVEQGPRAHLSASPISDAVLPVEPAINHPGSGRSLARFYTLYTRNS